MLDKKWDTPSGPLIYLETLKGLCHDTTHVWALTVADCFWILGSEQDARKEIYIIQDSLFAKRESFLFDFIYPHNSYLFSGIPQIYVQPIRIRLTTLSCFETNIYLRVFSRTHASKPVSDR